MLKRLIFIVFILSIVSYFGWGWYQQHHIDIYVLYDAKNNQPRQEYEALHGIVNACKKYKVVRLKEFDTSAITTMAADILTSKRLPLVLTCGVLGIDGLMKLHELAPRKYIGVHLAFQLLPEQAKLLTQGRKVDVMILPTHVIVDNLVKGLQKAGVTLIQTHGIPTHLNVSDIEKEYQAVSPAFAPAKCYVGVVLKENKSSDANDAEQEKQEVKKLAQYVAPLAKVKNCHLLITYLPKESKDDDLTAHSHQIFINELEEQGMVSNKDFTAYLSSPEHSYKAIMGAVHKTNDSLIILPGDAIELISQAEQTLINTKIFIYKNHSMNPLQQKFIDQERKRGALLEIGDTIIENHKKVQFKSTVDDLAKGLIMILLGRQPSVF